MLLDIGRKGFKLLLSLLVVSGEVLLGLWGCILVVLADLLVLCGFVQKVQGLSVLL